MGTTQWIIAGVGYLIFLVLYYKTPKDKRKEVGKKLGLVGFGIIAVFIFAIFAFGSHEKNSDLGRYQKDVDTVQKGVDALNGK